MLFACSTKYLVPRESTGLQSAECRVQSMQVINNGVIRRNSPVLHPSRCKVDKALQFLHEMWVYGWFKSQLNFLECCNWRIPPKFKGALMRKLLRCRRGCHLQAAGIEPERGTLGGIFFFLVLLCQIGETTDQEEINQSFVLRRGFKGNLFVVTALDVYSAEI